MSTERLYTDKEIGAILRRAGEMQTAQGTEETHGLSMEELQQIAAEVGLDPRLVAAAAAEMERVGVREGGFSWTGAPVKLQVERILPGEASVEQWAEMASEIGRALGVVGTSAQVGRTLEWTHASRRVQLQVTVTPGKGQTKVRIYGDFSRLAAVFFLPLTIISMFYGVMFSAAAALPWPAVGGIGLGTAMMVYLLVRLGYGSYFRKKERAAEETFKRLEKLMTAATAPTAARLEQSAERLDLPERDAQEAEREQARKRIRG